MPGGEHSLTWSLCIATLDRPDVLRRCVEHTLAQTVPSLEVVICDASDEWERTRDEQIAPLFGEDGPRLIYLQAPARSTAVQRNTAIEAASADIVFLIDDDAFMAPDCAENVLDAYRDEKIVAVGCSNSGAVDAGASEGLERKQSPGMRFRHLLSGNAVMRFISRRILMMDLASGFVPYDDQRPRWNSRTADLPEHLEPAELIVGYSLTVRRAIALQEPFDDGLIGSSQREDLDSVYRYGRHGGTVYTSKARIQHIEAAANRASRRAICALREANLAYFIHRNADRPEKSRRRWHIHMRRVIFAYFLRDLLSGRLDFPQAKGGLDALAAGKEVFARPVEGIREWYRERQRVLGRKPG